MTNIKIILKKHGLKPNKLLGQNFLIDRAVLKKIIAAAELSKNDTVLEVGPGLGILTEELAKCANQVIAVEKDKKMVEVVRNVLNDRGVRNVEIIQGDIRNSAATGYRLPPDYKIVANIPYYLTSRLIRKFLESDHPPQEMILMLQKEVAQRICAKPSKMSLLAVSAQFYAEPKIISYVSKKSFWPQPKVNSAIVRLTPHSIYRNFDMSICQREKNRSSDFFRVVRAGFSHPRKQLINNLSQGLKKDRKKITEALKKIGLKPEQRAETLNLADWLKLTKLV